MTAASPSSRGRESSSTASGSPASSSQPGPPPGHEAERFSRLHHYIVPLKESIVEVVAETVAVRP